MKNYSDTTDFMREVNRNFIIRIITFDEKGRQITHLVGYRTAINTIGFELFTKLYTRALEHGNNKERCKLRRGLIVDFYAR